MEEVSLISNTDYQDIVQLSPMPTKGPAGAAPGGLYQWISFLVGRVAHAARADFQTRLAPLKLTPKQFSLLVAVREAGASSQAKLGARLGVDRNTIVLLVDDLESRGMVRRCSLEGDRRANSVTITRTGLRMLEKAKVLAANSEGQIYASLSRSQREQFRCLLLQIVCRDRHWRESCRREADQQANEQPQERVAQRVGVRDQGRGSLGRPVHRSYVTK